ncbi:MAG: hypothetical protein Q9225_003293, partial [Loekoesia sp. 1 TL-2023]
MEYLYTHSFFFEQPHLPEPSSSPPTASSGDSSDSYTDDATERHENDSPKSMDCESTGQSVAELEFIDDYFDIGYRQYQGQETGKE